MSLFSILPPFIHSFIRHLSGCPSVHLLFHFSIRPFVSIKMYFPLAHSFTKPTSRGSTTQYSPARRKRRPAVAVTCLSWPAIFGDLYRFDPGANSWTLLTPTGTLPSARHLMGFVAASNGNVYLYGGRTGLSNPTCNSLQFTCMQPPVSFVWC